MNLDDLDFLRTSIRTVQQHLRKRLQGRVERVGFTLPQMRVIAAVVDQQGLGIKALAINLGMTQSTVSDIVDRLVAKQILVKRPNDEDNRAVQISATAAVEAFLAHDRGAFVNAPVAELMEGLGTEEQEIVLQAMRLLLARVQRLQQSDG